jgi:hypothetical protein
MNREVRGEELKMKEEGREAADGYVYEARCEEMGRG